MIRYSLMCEGGHRFDGWFSSSNAFEAQKSNGSLTCPHCGSQKVDRALMAPAVRTQRPGSAPASDPAPQAGDPAPSPADETIASPEPAPNPVALSDNHTTKLRAAAAAFRDALKESAQDVGRGFPEEARKVHYGEVRDRSIYGTASKDEVRELLDEGIDLMPIPVPPKASN